jgi:hypothetical protein
MVRSLVLVFLAFLALTEARRLKGTKSGKPSNGPKGGYKASKKSKYPVTVGSRPYFIVDSMTDSELKAQLSECAKTKSIDEKSDWSIGHRGACMQVRITSAQITSTRTCYYIPLINDSSLNSLFTFSIRYCTTSTLNTHSSLTRLLLFKGLVLLSVM